MDTPNFAVFRSWSVESLQIFVRMKERLDVVIARRKLIQASDGEDFGRPVDGGDNASSQVADIARHHRHCFGPCLVNHHSWFGTLLVADDDEKTARYGRKMGRDLKP